MSNHLCQLATDWRGDVPAGGMMCEQKVDGWRALWFPGIDGKRRLWTRGGHVIEGAGHITHRLEQMEREAGEPMVFDGEFQVAGTLAATKHWCERGWKTGGEAGVLHLFDCLTFAEWQAGGSDTPLIERKARLEALVNATGEEWDWRPGSFGRDDHTAVQIVPDVWIFDTADAMALAKFVWADGGEGIMLKDPLSPYRRLRSPAWLKVKVENSQKWMRRAA